MNGGILQQAATPASANTPWTRILFTVGQVFGTRVLGAGAAAVSTILVGRYLAPEAFGPFMALFALMTLVENLIGPALDASLVRFAARHITPERDDSRPYFQSVGWVKLAAGALVIVAGTAAAPWIHRQFIVAEGGAAVPVATVHLAIIGGAVVMVWRFAQAWFQAHGRFGRYARLELASAFLRLGFVFILCVAHVGAVTWFMAAYVIAPLVVSVRAWMQLPRDILHPRYYRPGVLGEFFTFSRWVVCAAVFATLAHWIAVVLLPLFGVSAAHRGHYFAAMTLANVGELAVLTMFHVLLPHASYLHGPEALQDFLQRFTLVCVGLAAAGAFCLPLAGFVVRWTYGPEYAQAAGVLMILGGGTLATLIGVPATTVIYSAGASYAIGLMEVGKFVAITVVGCVMLWLVHENKMVGMAGAIAGVKAAAAVATLFWAHHMLARSRIDDAVQKG